MISDEDQQKQNLEAYESGYLNTEKCNKCGKIIHSNNRYIKVVIHSYDKNEGNIAIRHFCKNCIEITDPIFTSNG